MAAAAVLYLRQFESRNYANTWYCHLILDTGCPGLTSKHQTQVCNCVLVLIVFYYFGSSSETVAVKEKQSHDWRRSGANELEAFCKMNEDCFIRKKTTTASLTAALTFQGHRLILVLRIYFSILSTVNNDSEQWVSEWTMSEWMNKCFAAEVFSFFNL